MTRNTDSTTKEQQRLLRARAVAKILQLPPEKRHRLLELEAKRRGIYLPPKD